MHAHHIYDVGDVVRFIRDAVASHKCGGRQRLYEEYYATCDVGPFWEFMIESYFNGETFKIDGNDSAGDEVAVTILCKMGIPIEVCWAVFRECFDILTAIVSTVPIPIGRSENHNTRAWLDHDGYSLHVDYRRFDGSRDHSDYGTHTGDHGRGYEHSGIRPIPRTNPLVVSGRGGDLYLRSDFRD